MLILEFLSRWLLMLQLLCWGPGLSAVHDRGAPIGESLGKRVPVCSGVWLMMFEMPVPAAVGEPR